MLGFWRLACPAQGGGDMGPGGFGADAAAARFAPRGAGALRAHPAPCSLAFSPLILPQASPNRGSIFLNCISRAIRGKAQSEMCARLGAQVGGEPCDAFAVVVPGMPVATNFAQVPSSRVHPNVLSADQKIELLRT